LPLASPILAVIVILTFMSTFNEFILAKIILQDVKQYTYAVGLYTFSTGPFETEWGLFTAAALIGMVPMVVLFLLMQRYIVGGLVSGAVKG
ncbi:MAG TPA: ABC transporter permease, partial [Fervidobacterium sp.]|nr:ABC transporter permease [Fervidobacterium sp.]